MDVNSGDPSWEVDILRDGVIVDTFILTKEVLPPRTNKKGKLVWKLPENGDKLVSAQAKYANEVRNISMLERSTPFCPTTYFRSTLPPAAFLWYRRPSTHFRHSQGTEKEAQAGKKEANVFTLS